MNAKRDDNHVAVGIGESTGGGTLPLLIDFVTGRLMIVIDASNTDTGTLNLNRAMRDDNHSPSMLGISDIDSEVPMSAAIDNTTKLLSLDLVIE